MVSFVTEATQPIPDQKTGTSGLRKKTSVFTSKNYLQNWVQSLFNAIGDSLKGSSIVLGGDGRYFNKQAAQIIIKMAAANGVKRIVVGQHGLLSTPAVSVVIRKHNLFGGIIMTASHNPGGATNDWGIKYNTSNGGPAPESVTNKIYAETLKISEYKIASFGDVDLSTVGTTTIEDFQVEVIDSCSDYVDLMKQIFNFDALKSLFASGFQFRYDAMHAVTGVYARRIFVQELGCNPEFITNAVPLEDFGGGHPDPNLTYAHDLVKTMQGPTYHLGAASDGDGDRNMILGGNGFFVTPSDSVAVIAANASCIPYFASGLRGLARSMPTSKALDSVAKKLGVEFFEVPTGWKFFGNLMDASRLSICGEESFGTGADHIREKDGIWSVLSWLQIIAAKSSGSNFALVADIVKHHWAQYGRNYFVRYDYEECDAAAANAMFAHLDTLIANPSSVTGASSPITLIDQFEYHDPIDGSVTSKQGVRILFDSGDRIIFRLSGTGSSGATIRLYVEHPETDATKFDTEATTACETLLQQALTWSKLKEFTGRSEPTVIT